VVALLLWAALLTGGITAVVRTTGVSLAIGAFFALLGALGLASTAVSRTWVDGTVLRHRTLLGHRPPVRLDRLRIAHLTNFDATNGRQLRLTDADGAAVEIDATNLRIKRLYEVLAGHIRHDSPVANELLQRRLSRYRRDTLH
jgi:hypothetical protein